MTSRCHIAPADDDDLPCTRAYRKKRRTPPRGGATSSYMRSLLCRADDMNDELLTRIAILRATISDLCDELNKRADPPTRDPGGTP